MIYGIGMVWYVLSAIFHFFLGGEIFCDVRIREANWLNCHAGLLASLLIILKKKRWQEKQKILKFITLWYPEKRNRFHIIRYIYTIYTKEDSKKVAGRWCWWWCMMRQRLRHQNIRICFFSFSCFFFFEKHHSTERQVGKHGHQEPTINTSKSDIRK